MSGIQDGRKTETYQGDAKLAGLLKEQRSFTDLEGLKAMIAGVAAAPSGDRADDWVSLRQHSKLPISSTAVIPMLTDCCSKQTSRKSSPTGYRLRSFPLQLALADLAAEQTLLRWRRASVTVKYTWALRLLHTGYL